jgi:hypothetical protein
MDVLTVMHAATCMHVLYACVQADGTETSVSPLFTIETVVLDLYTSCQPDNIINETRFGPSDCARKLM